MKKLTSKKYWDSPYKDLKSGFNYSSYKITDKSYYMYDLYKTIRPFILKKSKIIEIGCAPGNYIIAIAKKFDLRPHGVEYSLNGHELTQANFEYNGFRKNDVIYSDFFSKKFQKEHKGKYDIVISMGFIEHFDDARHVVKLHENLLKKGGVIILTVPNLIKANKYFITKDIMEKHNLDIMTPMAMSKLMGSNFNIRRVVYFGGPFNIGLYQYKNKFLEIIRLGLFIIQRAIFDPLFWVLNKIGFNFNNRWFSPSIILIAEKK